MAVPIMPVLQYWWKLTALIPENYLSRMHSPQMVTGKMILFKRIMEIYNALKHLNLLYTIAGVKKYSKAPIRFLHGMETTKTARRARPLLPIT